MKVWQDTVGVRAVLRLQQATPRSRRRSFPTSAVAAFLIATAAVTAMAQPAAPVLLFESILIGVVLLAAVIAFRTPGADTLVLVGASPIAAVAASVLAERPKGRMAIHQAPTLAEAAAVVRSRRCSEVIMAESVSLGGPDLVDARGVRPAITPGIEAVERMLGRVPLKMVDLSTVRPNGGWVRSGGRFYAAVKRSVDIAFSVGLGLAVLPIVPLIALAIRLDSPGTVFYTQNRVGLNGQIFRIVKFRTMRSDAEKNGAVWARVGDSRVTRTGRFMRLTRIDELPQLWNVLKGEMTLVGPRPERPEFTSMLEQEIPDYAGRYAMKPGLTGWAQVCYRYASSVRDAEAKLEYDLYYVKYASLALDLKILFRTIYVVLKMRGC